MQFIDIEKPLHYVLTIIGFLMKDLQGMEKPIVKYHYLQTQKSAELQIYYGKATVTLSYSPAGRGSVIRTLGGDTKYIPFDLILNADSVQYQHLSHEDLSDLVTLKNRNSISEKGAPNV